MKIKLIGLGQCGSFVVYDVLAFLFEAKSSKELRSNRREEWKKDVQNLVGKGAQPWIVIKTNIEKYFKGQKVTDLPACYVVDGNRDNKVVDGLRDSQQKTRIEELQVHVKALSLTHRNNGCALGQIGEYYFKKEAREARSVIDQIEINDDNTQANIIVFAAAGGSGSGGSAVLNGAFNGRDVLLMNMMVLPSTNVTSKRQKWNTDAAFHVWRQSESTPHSCCLVIYLTMVNLSSPSMNIFESSLFGSLTLGIQATFPGWRLM